MKNIVIGYPANLILKSSIFKCSKFLSINEQIQNIAQKKDTLCRRMYN